MSAGMHELGIDRMSAEERLNPIGEIWDSLADEQAFKIPVEHRRILDRRIEEVDRDPHRGSTWE